MSKQTHKLSFVVPVYNEQDTVDVFINEVFKVFENIKNYDIEIVFVNDGSTDATLTALKTLRNTHGSIKIVDLSRNFGKEAALSAGLKHATGDAIIPIDVDLQDPPHLVLEMLELWEAGSEVVLAKRVDRDSDSYLKRLTAHLFYKFFNIISETNIPENVGDFRLMDRKVVEVINRLPESRRFMKGLFSWVGFKTSYITYRREKRSFGSSKFSGWKLWNLAVEGITSFSIVPLKFWVYFGSFVSLWSIAFAFYIVIRTLIYGIEVPGYASTMVAITFLGGIQLVGIGIIGEYIGRIYIESKKRPVYVVREIIENENKDLT